MSEIVNNVADIVLLSALLPNLVFTVRYFFFSPFELSREGINLLGQKVAISLLVIVVLLSVFLGADYAGRPFIRLVVFGAISYFFWTEMVQLIQLQRQYPWRRVPKRK